MKTFEELEVGDNLYTYDATKNSTIKEYTVIDIINICTEDKSIVISVQDNLSGHITPITFFKNERHLTKLLLAGFMLTNNKKETYEFRGHITAELNKNFRHNHKTIN